MAAGWPKHTFSTRVMVDGRERESSSHEIDHVRRAPAGTLALEIEWNNKDPFFDRDLENFQRLHAMGAISVGILVTRGASLQAALTEHRRRRPAAGGDPTAAELEAWGVKERTSRQRRALEARTAGGLPFADAFAQRFVADKFTTSTTHWDKLDARIAAASAIPVPCC